MDIRGLGYIGIDVTDIEQWETYAELLGMMVIGKGTGLRLRVDERPFRVLVGAAEGGDRLAFAGWELPDAAALQSAATELAVTGVTAKTATPEECSQRQVRGLVRATDPNGFALELFHGPIYEHEPFISPTGVSGFVTGAQGMGHIVLGTPDPGASVAFYTEVLGFRVSDFWRPAKDDVVFLRCNRRHHSLALVPASEPALYHFMVEARTRDDVGNALDRHHDVGAPVSMGIGRHTNDKMVSFYSRSPSGFDVEVGYDGLLVDEATWTVSQITKPSFWGHRQPE